MPRHLVEYGNLLKALIAEHGVNCWLVSTGWTGGAYGIGKRMPIKATRTLLTALSGELNKVDFRKEENLLASWPLSKALKARSSIRVRPGPMALPTTQAKKLAGMFVTNLPSSKTMSMVR